MTALVALLGGVRATVFAGLLLAMIGWAGVQSARLKAAHRAAGAAQADLTVANARIDGFRALLGEVNAVADAEVEKAKAKAADGEAKAAKSDATAKAADDRAADAEHRLQAAKAALTCADQLRMTLCPAIPLL